MMGPEDGRSRREQQAERGRAGGDGTERIARDPPAEQAVEGAGNGAPGRPEDQHGQHEAAACGLVPDEGARAEHARAQPLLPESERGEGHELQPVEQEEAPQTEGDLRRHQRQNPNGLEADVDGRVRDGAPGKRVAEQRPQRPVEGSVGNRGAECIRHLEQRLDHRQREPQPQHGIAEDPAAAGGNRVLDHLQRNSREREGQPLGLDPVLPHQGAQTEQTKVAAEGEKRPCTDRRDPLPPWQRRTGRHPLVEPVDRVRLMDKQPCRDMGQDDLGPVVPRRGKELGLHRIDHGVDEQPLARHGGGDRHHRVDEQQLRSRERRGRSGPPQNRVERPDEDAEEE